MPSRTVNPTPPILLTLVTLLFAVAWNYDRPAVASRCVQHPVAATTPAPCKTPPVENVRPLPTITRTSLLTVVGDAPFVDEPAVHCPLELIQSTSPTDRPALPVAAARDWLARLIARAEQHIQR